MRVEGRGSKLSTLNPKPQALNPKPLLVQVAGGEGGEVQVGRVVGREGESGEGERQQVTSLRHLRSHEVSPVGGGDQEEGVIECVVPRQAAGGGSSLGSVTFDLQKLLLCREY